ncbi:MAG: AAA family ATPase [Nanobdellota archaeon]
MLDFNKLRDTIKGKVIGQDDAIDTIIDGIILEYTKTKESDKPWNYLAIGPTGVGKNYTFEVVTEELAKESGLERSFRTVNCSNFQSEGSANQLVGSPKGYVGHQDEGILTSFFNQSISSPLRVLLFDEFEKSQKRVIDLLLPMLDKGGLYDNKENYIDMTGSWIAFTSNLGYSDLRAGKKQSMGFSSDRENREKTARRQSVENSITKYLSPEFINRVNIVHFNYLERPDFEKIFDLELGKLTKNANEVYNIDIECSRKAKDSILEAGTCTDYGARFLKSKLESMVAIPLSQKLHNDAQVDRNWAKEKIELLEELKSKENVDISAIDDILKDGQEARKLPYNKLNITLKDGKVQIKS